MAREAGCGATGNDPAGCSIVSFPCWRPLYSALRTDRTRPCSISCFHFFPSIGVTVCNVSEWVRLTSRFSSAHLDTCTEKGPSPLLVHK